MLKLNNISFKFDKEPILNDVSLELKPQEIVALIGTSGSGKTTLLRLISGRLKPSRGDVSSPPSQTYMSQKDLLLPWRTVKKNIALPLELEGKELSPEKLSFLLNNLELEELIDRYPHELSGGQYKRVMLAQALAADKKLLLLDEPFSSLDLPLRDKLYIRLKSLSNASILLVTHDFRDAFTLADRILLLKQGSIASEWHLNAAEKTNPAYMGELFHNLSLAL